MIAWLLLADLDQAHTSRACTNKSPHRKHKAKLDALLSDGFAVLVLMNLVLKPSGIV